MRIGFPLDCLDKEKESWVELFPYQKNGIIKITYCSLDSRDVISDSNSPNILLSDSYPLENHIACQAYFDDRSLGQRAKSLAYFLPLPSKVCSSGKLVYAGESPKLALLLAFCQQAKPNEKDPIVLISANWEIINGEICVEPLKPNVAAPEKSLLKKWNQARKANASALVLHKTDAITLSQKASISSVSIKEWILDPKFQFTKLVSVGPNDIYDLALKLDLPGQFFGKKNTSKADPHSHESSKSHKSSDSKGRPPAEMYQVVLLDTLDIPLGDITRILSPVLRRSRHDLENLLYCKSPLALGKFSSYEKAFQFLRKLKSKRVRATICNFYPNKENVSFYRSNASGVIWARISSMSLTDFDIMVYPVDQYLYKHIVGKNPSKIKCKLCPVESVSLEDAWKFCEKLADYDKCPSDYYRLPNVAEWQIAASCGKTTRFSGSDNWGSVAVGRTRHPEVVGSRQPNTWGIYDMSGSVWEWCSDSIESNPEQGIACGGSFLSTENDLAINSKKTFLKNEKHCDVGFRVIRKSQVTKGDK